MARRPKKVAPSRRGDVYLVQLDPTVGAEIRKTRPAVIIQNDVANRASSVTIVAAISSQFSEELYPTEVLVRAGEGGLRVASVVLTNQLRTVDRRRLVRRMGSLRPETLLHVDRALMISLGLIEL